MIKHAYILIVIIFSAASGQSTAGTLGSVEGSKWHEGEYQLKELLAITGTDEEVKEAYKEMMLARMWHEEKALEERAAVVYWTNRVGIFIFIITHLVLFFGVWAAIKEYISASKIRSTEVEQSEIKVSLEGVALKTSLHGTLLFALTLFMYFLFLKFVYPIIVI